MDTQSTKGFLLLEDGTLFHGRLVGDFGPTVAEVVFTTNMTGYQEVFTDPSYREQIVVMTATQIGNYGVNNEDPESSRPQVSGIVVRELSATYSSWRATGSRAWVKASAAHAGGSMAASIRWRRRCRRTWNLSKF